MSILYLTLLSAVCVGVLGTPLSSKPTPVSVTLYYESLCPGCGNFIENLQSVYTQKDFDFASLISKLTLVPYGIALIADSEKHIYFCQHGPSECLGNKLHGCAVSHVDDTVTLLEYITCLEKTDPSLHNRTYYPAEMCQEKLPADLYQTVMKCYNSDEGWNIFNSNGVKTDKFMSSFFVRFVPYISFNDKVDDNLTNNALKDFRHVLCTLAGVDDKACTDVMLKGTPPSTINGNKNEKMFNIYH